MYKYYLICSHAEMLRYIIVKLLPDLNQDIRKISTSAECTETKYDEAGFIKWENNNNMDLLSHAANR